MTTITQKMPTSSTPPPQQDSIDTPASTVDGYHDTPSMPEGQWMPVTREPSKEVMDPSYITPAANSWDPCYAAPRIRSRPGGSGADADSPLPSASPTPGAAPVPPRPPRRSRMPPEGATESGVRRPPTTRPWAEAEADRNHTHLAEAAGVIVGAVGRSPIARYRAEVEAARGRNNRPRLAEEADKAAVLHALDAFRQAEARFYGCGPFPSRDRPPLSAATSAAPPQARPPGPSTTTTTPTTPTTMPRRPPRESGEWGHAAKDMEILRRARRRRDIIAASLEEHMWLVGGGGASSDDGGPPPPVAAAEESVPVALAPSEESAPAAPTPPEESAAAAPTPPDDTWELISRASEEDMPHLVTYDLVTPDGIYVWM